MEKREVNTKNAPVPVGPYSQAVIAGDFIFCSGQIALDPRTGKMVDGDIERETRQVMENLGAVLKEADSSLDRVVKTTIFLHDMNDFPRVNEVYAGYFRDIPPSRATVQAAGLPGGARIEIECIALKNGE